MHKSYWKIIYDIPLRMRWRMIEYTCYGIAFSNEWLKYLPKVRWYFETDMFLDIEKKNLQSILTENSTSLHEEKKVKRFSLWFPS